MLDPAIQNAILTRDECLEKIVAAENQVSEWKARVARAERFISDWEEFSGQKLPSSTVSENIKMTESASSPKPKNPKKEEVAEVACQIILDRGAPMTRDELFETLPLRGINIYGQNPAVVLQTMLWRTKERIVHLKGFGYWIKERAYAPAGYRPDENQADAPLEAVPTTRDDGGLL